MFYIDDYKSKPVVNAPPGFKEKQEQKKQHENDVLNLFWYSIGVTIAEQFDSVKNLLGRYGHNVSSEEEAATAVTDILHTKRWPKFVEEMSPFINKTVDKKFPAAAGM